MPAIHVPAKDMTHHCMHSILTIDDSNKRVQRVFEQNPVKGTKDRERIRL